MQSSRKLLLVDDHSLFRASLNRLIGSFNIFDEIFEASNGKEALSILTTSKIDIMMLDISMPEMDGKTLLHELDSQCISTGVIVLTMYNEPELIRSLFQMGIRGFLSKNADPDEMIEAIMCVMNGDVFLPKKYNHVLKPLISRYQPPYRLSQNDLIIIHCLSKGLTSKEIAACTGYTHRTVETKRIRLERKLSVKNTAELINKAYKIGLLRVEV